jgi:photosystem II stability/assembly factor-like uncharacterized protein
MDRLTADALRARVRAAIGEPEVTGQGFDLAAARARRRRWWALGLGTAPAPVRAASMVALVVAVAAVVTVGTVIHLQGLPKPAGSSSGPAGVSQSNPATASPAATIPLGPAVDGFVPEDVTAVSADQWWVLGIDGGGCAGTDCTRILHTQDGGHTFTSLPVPPAALTGLRFLNSEDGWAFGASTVWSTQDGGADWSGTILTGTVEELETSGSYVYAIVDEPGALSVWTLDRSPISSSGWEVMTATRGEQLGNLNVHGKDVWMSETFGQASDQVYISTDDAAHFTATPICPEEVGITSLYAATTQDLWATCSTASSDEVWRSTDGGQAFTEVQSGTEPEPGWSSIAGVSASTAVLAGTSLQQTVDGGQSFRPVLDNGDDWSIVGFTTAEDGFALSYPNSSFVLPSGLWRTGDGGASWYEVQLP